jgi:hypothetical protein
MYPNPLHTTIQPPESLLVASYGQPRPACLFFYAGLPALPCPATHPRTLTLFLIVVAVLTDGAI